MKSQVWVHHPEDLVHKRVGNGYMAWWSIWKILLPEHLITHSLLPSFCWFLWRNLWHDTCLLCCTSLLMTFVFWIWKGIGVLPFSFDLSLTAFSPSMTLCSFQWSPIVSQLELFLSQDQEPTGFYLIHLFH